MKKITMTLAMALLAGTITGWAQSGAGTQNKTNSQHSSSLNKANSSQLKGTGVPYSKEKEQFGKPVSKKKSSSVSPPSVSSGPGVSDATLKGKTPGSHVSQREVKMGRKTSAKTGANASKKRNQ